MGKREGKVFQAKGTEKCKDEGVARPERTKWDGEEDVT